MKAQTSPLHPAAWLIAMVSGVSLLRAQVPPRIVEAPQDQYVSPGAEVVLRVVAEGDEPLSYQWLRNGVAAPGATLPIWTIQGFQSYQSGLYSVQVRNPHGEMTTAPVVVQTVPVLAWGTNQFRQATVPAGLNEVVAVSAGRSHVLALTADGRVVAWGHKGFKETAVPEGLSNVVALSAGTHRSLAVTADGRVVAWGLRFDPQLPAVPEGLSNVVAGAAGMYFHLVLQADGRLGGWGRYFDGASYPPFSVPLFLNAVAIACGRDHALALQPDGRVAAWGRGDKGQTRVPDGLSNVVAIAAGLSHSLALTSEGRVVGWGDNTHGQISIPHGLSNVVAIAAGWFHSLALTQEGKVIGWGKNHAGQATPPPGMRQVLMIAAGEDYSVCLAGLPAGKAPPQVLGPRVLLGSLHQPLRAQVLAANVPESYAAEGLPEGLTLDPVTGVLSGSPTEAGEFRVRLRAVNGQGEGESLLHLYVRRPQTRLRLLSWGTGGAGLPPEERANVVMVAPARTRYTLALTADGQVIGWGDETNALSAMPGGLTNLATIAAGWTHALGLTADGRVVAWGDHTDGQTQVPQGLSNVVAVAAGGAHSLALTGEGRVVAWGRNNFGQATVPAGLSNVVAIAAGEAYSLALRADGFVAGWGANNEGQVSIPEGLSNVVAISAGWGHNLALTAEGRVVAWGSGWWTEVPQGLSNVISISAGAWHSMALTAEGQVVAWGNNTLGESWPPAASVPAVAIAAGAGVSYGLYEEPGAVVPPGQPPVVYGPRVQLAIMGRTFSTRIQVAPKTPSDTFETEGLPPGLKLDRQTGVISGRPEEPGVYEVKLRVTNFAGSGETTLRLYVHRVPLILTYPSLVVMTRSASLRQTLCQANTLATFTVEGLPPGAEFDPHTGTISGVVEALGDFPVQVTASNRFEVVRGTLTLRSTPIGVFAPEGHPVRAVPPGLDRVVAVAAGRNHALALTADGRVVAWGSNQVRQAQVPDGMGSVVAIAAAGDHSLALTASGQVWGWGDTQVRMPAALASRRFVAIAAGEQHALALTEEGQVVSWGVNRFGQTSVPLGLSNVVAIAAGEYHSLALTARGEARLWGWYMDASGTMSPVYPDLASQPLAAAGGRRHTTLLLANGTLANWGAQAFVEIPPPAWTDAVSVAAGFDFSLALRADGRVAAWGQNDHIPASHFETLRHAVAVGAYGNVGLVAVAAPPETAAPLLPEAKVLVGTADLPFQAWLLTGPRTESLTAEGLPAELTLDPVRGLVTGTAPDPGEYFVTVRAANAQGTSEMQVRLVINAPLPGIILPDPELSVVLGKSLDYPLKLVHPVTSLAVEGLPLGLSLDPLTAAIRGPAVLPGLHPLTVTLSNRFGSLSVPMSLYVESVITWGWGTYEPKVPRLLTNVVAVASGLGGFHVALHADGRVTRWGYNPPYIPAQATNLIAVSAGWWHCLGLTEDGRVLAWGGGYPDGRYRVPAGLSNVVAIAAGSNHDLALTAEGRVIGWGDPPASTPPPGLSNVVAIAANDRVSLALTAAGQVVAWGDPWGQQPRVLEELGEVVALSAGEVYGLALTPEGGVISWEYDVWGDTGRPILLHATNVVAISAGRYQALRLTQDGQVLAWGWSSRVPALSNFVAVAGGAASSVGVLGAPPGYLPPRVLGPRTLVAFYGHPVRARVAVANGVERIEADGLPRGLGVDAATGWFTGVPHEVGVFQVTLRAVNAQGIGESRLRLHVNPTPPAFAKPAWVWHARLGEPVQFEVRAFGLPHEFAASGLPEGWVLDPVTGRVTGVSLQPGDYLVSLRVRNLMGESTASVQVRVSPVYELGPAGPSQAEVPDDTASVVALAAGAEHTVALTSEGRVLAWGDNRRGQTRVPPDLGPAVAVAAGGYHSVALSRDGRVRVWGDNGYGQVALTPTLRRVVAVAAGWGHTLALSADGRVTGWGWNVFGQGDHSPPVSNAVAIAAGYYHSLALTADGRVVGWGRNEHGQATPPPGLESVTALAAGGNHSLALTASGQVVAWGDNQWGQAQVPEGLNRVVALAAGEAVSLAWTEEGRLVAWGRDAERLTSGVPERADLVFLPTAHAEHAAVLAVPVAAYAAPRLWVRVEEDWVLLNWQGGRGPFRVWQAWELKPERWMPWGGWRWAPWATFRAEPDQQFLRLEGH